MRAGPEARRYRGRSISVACCTRLSLTHLRRRRSICWATIYRGQHALAVSSFGCKLKTEKVEQFNQLDDAEFAVLRRKFARFAADNAAALNDAKPIIPSDLINRDAANWWLLLAIAELAGGEWPKRAREAAERLTRRGRRPSEGVQL